MAADQVNESTEPHEPAGLPMTDWLWFLRPFETNGVIETWPDAATPGLPTAALDMDSLAIDISTCAWRADGFLRVALSWGHNVADPPVIAYQPYVRDLLDPLSSDLAHTVSKNDMKTADLSTFVIGEPTRQGQLVFQGWWIRVAAAVGAVQTAYVQISRFEHTRRYFVSQHLQRIGARPEGRTDLRQTLPTETNGNPADPLKPSDTDA